MITRQMADDGQRDNKRYWERAKYYEQQGDNAQAFINYVESLDALAKYIYWEEASWEGERISAGRTSLSSWDTQSKINLLIALSNGIIAIIEHYNDPLKEAFLLEKQSLIFEMLSDFERSFEVEDIKFYNALSKLVKESKHQVSNYQTDIDNIKKIKPENEPDQILKKIREALQKVSSTTICSLELEPSLKSSGSCFIATAAYSTSTHPDLDTFRNFRDQKLLTNPVGKRLVSLYYQISPSIAQYMERQPTIKSFARQQLERLAQWMRNQSVKN